MLMTRLAYRLPILTVNRTSLDPGDLVILIFDATLSGSSATIDLSKSVRDGAVVHYFVFKPATVSASGTITAAAAVAGASDAAKVVVLVEQKDLKFAGE